MATLPPRHVSDAAAVVNGWLDQQQRALSPDEIAKLSPADRLDYTRTRSQQTQMPAWKDPRTA
jgi:hypothetical protein